MIKIGNRVITPSKFKNLPNVHVKNINYRLLSLNNKSMKIYDNDYQYSMFLLNKRTNLEFEEDKNVLKLTT